MLPGTRTRFVSLECVLGWSSGSQAHSLAATEPTFKIAGFCPTRHSLPFRLSLPLTLGGRPYHFLAVEWRQGESRTESPLRALALALFQKREAGHRRACHR
jgi:hypothetical protein